MNARVVALLFSLALPVALATPGPGSDGRGWPTLHGDLQRSGFYPEFPQGPLRLRCSPEQLFCTHQGNLGAFDLKTGLIANLYGKRDSYGGFYGAVNFGWENQGGYQRAEAAGQPYGLVNEWHGPARAIVSVVGHKVFFPVGSQVLCLEGAK